jgi:hypothetical protein
VAVQIGSVAQVGKHGPQIAHPAAEHRLTEQQLPGGDRGGGAPSIAGVPRVRFTGAADIGQAHGQSFSQQCRNLSRLLAQKTRAYPAARR